MKVALWECEPRCVNVIDPSDRLTRGTTPIVDLRLHGSDGSQTRLDATLKGNGLGFTGQEPAVAGQFSDALGYRRSGMPWERVSQFGESRWARKAFKCAGDR